MAHLKLRFLAFLASLCMVVSISEAPRPTGGLDDIVWIVAYALIALATAVVAIFPSRQTLRIWASLTIGTQVIRAVQLGLYPTLPQYRWGSVAANLFFGILAFFVWEGWRRNFEPDGDYVYQSVPLKVLESIEQEDHPYPPLAVRDPDPVPTQVNADFSRHWE